MSRWATDRTDRGFKVARSEQIVPNSNPTTNSPSGLGVALSPEQAKLAWERPVAKAVAAEGHRAHGQT